MPSPARTNRRHKSADKASTPRRHQSGQKRGSRPPRRAHHNKSRRQRQDVIQERYSGTPVTSTSHHASTFGELGLSAALESALRTLGATAPFPIQAATIPDSLTGRDILARGHTGSGKTISFGAAMVERLAPGGRSEKRRERGRAPVGLILAPTRELAAQINRTVQPLARAVGLFTTQVVGGVPQSRQVQALQRGTDIVIGTPGRLEDLITQGHLDISSVWITVVDEADHMSELGFAEPVARLLAGTQGGSQKLFFSATLDRAVSALVERFLVAPAIYELQSTETTDAAIDHHLFLIQHGDQRGIIEALSTSGHKTLVFTRTRAAARELASHLETSGIPSASLHGDLSQGQRQRNLGKLSSGKARVLVATDVAARGIHVDDIALVIHADPAEEHKTYVHRSGRTGRAGSTGRVVTLASRSREREVTGLLTRAGVRWTTTAMKVGSRELADFTQR